MVDVPGIRERNRAALTGEIKAAARAELAEHGAAGLSVRAVTRALGMASSAVYRYFPSRDALLTALIIDAYDDIADAAQAAHDAVPAHDVRARWRAVFAAARAWALAHPHEYALIYGSPVPGYQAPQDTIGPATRIALLLGDIAITAATGEGGEPSEGEPDALTGALGQDARRLIEHLNQGATRSEALDPDDANAQRIALAVVDAWTRLFGTLNFELFGHYVNGITAGSAYLDRMAQQTADACGIPR